MAHLLSLSQSPTRSKGFGTEGVNVKAIEMLGGGEEEAASWGGGNATVAALCTENSRQSYPSYHPSDVERRVGSRKEQGFRG